MKTITFSTLLLVGSVKIFAQDSAINNNIQTSFFYNLVWWHYVLISLLLVCLVILFDWLLFRKKFVIKKNPITKKYNGGSFEDFALTSNITRQYLFKHNKKLLSTYDNAEDKTQRKKLKNELLGTDLIIDFASGNPLTLFELATGSFRSSEKKGQKEISKSNLALKDQIAVMVNTMEQRINNAIDSFASNQDALEQVERLQKDNDSLKENISLIDNEKSKITEERDSFLSELSNLKEEKQKIELENNRYRQKVIFVDTLDVYSVLVGEYFNLIDSGYKKALELFNEMVEKEDKNSFIVGQLLLKYQSNLPSNIGYWKAIVSEIKDNKATSNSELVNGFRQLTNDEEKLSNFRQILFKESLNKYSDCNLILTEELSKLSKFMDNPTPLVRDFERYFSNFSSSLHSELRAIRLEFKHIPLFENYVGFAANMKRTDQRCSAPYRQIADLKKEDILEVVSYGFDNEETKVILF